MTVRHLAAVGVAALLATGSALPASAQTSAATSASETDTQAYVLTTEQNDLFSIIEGRMAVQRGQTEALRAYAARSVKAHMESTKSIEAAARANGVATRPAVLTTEQRRLVDQLARTTPARFGAVFVDQHRDLNRETLALQRGYAAGGSDPALRNVARRLADGAEDRVSQLQALEP